MLHCQLLQYTVNDVSFSRYEEMETEPVFFKGNYYAFALDENCMKPNGLMQQYGLRSINVTNAPFLYQDLDTVEKGEILGMFGLFQIGRPDISPAERQSQINDLKSLPEDRKIGHMIGFGGLSADEKNNEKAWLAGSHIQTFHRRKGLSRLLYQSRLDLAMKNNFSTVATKINVNNKISIRAAKAFGFQPPENIDRMTQAGLRMFEFKRDLTGPI